MNQDDKRRLENELTVMGLPGLDNPALVQVMADIVNGYPAPGERADFFCDLLNECQGARRREMYEALRPRLSFPVPSLDACEAQIAAKAERMIRPKSKVPSATAIEDPTVRSIEVECQDCRRIETFTGATTVDAMSEAKKAGWGPVRYRVNFEIHRKFCCADCRMTTMPAQPFGESFTRRFGDALEA